MSSKGALCIAVFVCCSLPLHFAQTQAPAPADTDGGVCKHEKYPEMSGSIEIRDGETIYRDVQMNDTHRYFYRNFNVTTMGQPDIYRKLIINLEPCRGVVYLFVRKTRRCYPNPYSCISLGADGFRDPSACEWSHFHSVIDGRRVGAPTFFEVPLSTTKWFIAIFAAEKSSYTLTIVADIGSFPRPGGLGKIDAMQLRELQVQLQWKHAGFIPEGITQVKTYWIYSSLLLESDNRTNMAVFLRPAKIMNTVCGLKNNTDKHYSMALPGAACDANGTCNATIDGVITDKRYVFNIVVESERGMMRAYSGIIMRSDWEVVRQATSDKTLRVVGVVAGSVLAMVVIVYVLMLKLYGG